MEKYFFLDEILCLPTYIIFIFISNSDFFSAERDRDPWKKLDPHPWLYRYIPHVELSYYPILEVDLIKIVCVYCIFNSS